MLNKKCPMAFQEHLRSVWDYVCTLDLYLGYISVQMLMVLGWVAYMAQATLKRRWRLRCLKYRETRKLIRGDLHQALLCVGNSCSNDTAYKQVVSILSDAGIQTALKKRDARAIFIPVLFALPFIHRYRLHQPTGSVTLYFFDRNGREVANAYTVVSPEELTSCIDTLLQ